MVPLVDQDRSSSAVSAAVGDRQRQDPPLMFHLVAKPTGAICNLDCSYCSFLSKEMLYPGSRFRMADELLETYIRQLIEAHSRAGGAVPGLTSRPDHAQEAHRDANCDQPSACRARAAQARTRRWDQAASCRAAPAAVTRGIATQPADGEAGADAHPPWGHGRAATGWSVISTTASRTSWWR